MTGASARSETEPPTVSAWYRPPEPIFLRISQNSVDCTDLSNVADMFYELLQTSPSNSKRREKKKRFILIRVFRVSFFQNRPYWKAHRGSPSRELPTRGAGISLFKKKKM